MGIFPGAMAWIIFTGACIMQNKQAFTTTPPAQCLGITQKMDLETSEGCTDMTQTNTSQVRGKNQVMHLRFTSQ